jgi:flagellar basal-body rod protein FlgB
MGNSIEAATVGAVSLALDAATLRHQAIAANISNASTPGYQPLRVNFEQQLDALRSSLERGGGIDSSLLAAVQPSVEREQAVTSTDGSSAVALDMEVAKLSQNTVHYQALLRALNRQFAILATAINEGKR